MSHPRAGIQAGLLRALPRTQDHCCLPPLQMLLLPWVRMPAGTVWGAPGGLWGGYGVGAVYLSLHLEEYREYREQLDLSPPALTLPCWRAGFSGCDESEQAGLK